MTVDKLLYITKLTCYCKYASYLRVCIWLLFLFIVTFIAFIAV